MGHTVFCLVFPVYVCIITTKIKYPKTNWNKVRIPVSLKKMDCIIYIVTSKTFYVKLKMRL